MTEQWVTLKDDDSRYASRTQTPQPQEEMEKAHMLSPNPSTPTDSVFAESPQPRQPRSLSSMGFVSSPLNPSSPLPTSVSPFTRGGSRPASRGSMYINRIASEDSRALSSAFSSMGAGDRGSMVLYRLATEVDETGTLLPPPGMGHAGNRDSMMSSSGDSIVSYSSDSKYPSAYVTGGQRGLVPYAYDPSVDEQAPDDEEDHLHDPNDKDKSSGVWGSRGFLNIGVLLLLILGLLLLFIFYPVLTYLRDNPRNLAIDGNIRINGTGQAPVLFQMPQLIDPDTPAGVKTRTGTDGQPYELVFSDEFNTDGRTFYPGDDPFWEAVDLWYGATADMEWYDPSQVTTKDGKLQITIENVQNHGLDYKSGMLQSWNKFCFTAGYIEVSVSFPGPNENTQGYWPGIWTMGNLGRPGYGGTTDGMWPYTYDSCDVGTFPNQTLRDGSGPPAALHTDQGRANYNMELSWLSGQRLSACTCPGEDHAGPTNNRGRGAPEIDVLEAERNKQGAGHVVSQSSQFAPFTHDYDYDATQFTVTDPTISRLNTYHGSAVQQALSAITQIDPTLFQQSGGNFGTFGFEYWSDPANPTDGFITWVADGKVSATMNAAAVGPDQGADGSGISQRLVSVEPMSIILNLGMSQNWQVIDLTTMIFPAVLQIDYVRVYQRKGQTNVGCNPSNYPTTDYIANHLDAYTNPNLTAWPYPKPKNGLWEGGC